MTASRGNRVLVALMALLVVCAWLPWSQEAAREQSEAGLKRALIAYGAARAINAVISFAQSTEVSLQPAGVGVATHPAEVLDPLNDLVEQFSSLMLMAAVAFGIQRLLTDIGAHHLVVIGLSLSLVAGAVLLLRTGRISRWLRLVLAVMLAVRFAMPVAVIASESVHRALFEGRYERATAALNEATGGVAGAASSEPSLPRRWGDWMPWLKKAPEEAKPTTEANEGVIARMNAFFDKGVSHFVELAAIFIVHTVVLPLLTLWLILQGLRRAVREPERASH